MNRQSIEFFAMLVAIALVVGCAPLRPQHRTTAQTMDVLSAQLATVVLKNDANRVVRNVELAFCRWEDLDGDHRASEPEVSYVVVKSFRAIGADAESVRVLPGVYRVTYEFRGTDRGTLFKFTDAQAVHAGETVEFSLR